MDEAYEEAFRKAVEGKHYVCRVNTLIGTTPCSVYEKTKMVTSDSLENIATKLAWVSKRAKIPLRELYSFELPEVNTPDKFYPLSLIEKLTFSLRLYYHGLGKEEGQ